MSISEKVRLQHDTLVLHERDSVHIIERGDTVRIIETHIVERARVVHKVDTVAQVVQLPGSPYIPPWGKRLMGIAAGIVVLAIGWLIYKGARWYIKIRTGL